MPSGVRSGPMTSRTRGHGKRRKESKRIYRWLSQPDRCTLSIALRSQERPNRTDLLRTGEAARLGGTRKLGQIAVRDHMLPADASSVPTGPL